MTTGDVYSRQKCPTCGASFTHDPKRRALVCQTHRIQATGGYYAKFGRAINKRFLHGLDVSDKTRANYRSTIHDFFTRFLVEEEVLENPVKVPGVQFELGYRTVTDIETQGRILGEIRVIAANPKVALGIDLLRTYIALRPGDLARLTEADTTTKSSTTKSSTTNRVK